MYFNPNFSPTWYLEFCPITNSHPLSRTYDTHNLARDTAARHETHHGQVLRHAMEQGHHERPAGTIHPHPSHPSTIALPSSLHTHFLHLIFFFFLSLEFFLSGVIEFKVDRSKVIFSG